MNDYPLCPTRLPSGLAIGAAMHTPPPDCKFPTFLLTTLMQTSGLAYVHIIADPLHPGGHESRSRVFRVYTRFQFNRPCIYCRAGRGEGRKLTHNWRLPPRPHPDILAKRERERWELLPGEGITHRDSRERKKRYPTCHWYAVLRVWRGRTGLDFCISDLHGLCGTPAMLDVSKSPEFRTPDCYRSASVHPASSAMEMTFTA